ncbi:hypothetical protein [Photobacterium galatheae]|uniref:Lipoprotein n=1 Tax=Photobacterium galatheae TaxID=1654360 RepID=A0A066RTN8_9GAMM|nr:hypothetical protein [Photobacterium galatheae]KDM90728.1 hypothetical protein EA58_15180 [Photobacterium galatheae]MCM0149942.1 hypothetical protein [Photobacterium galatheae]
MSWHVIRIFWLSFFAWVLPAQAMACLDDKGATTGQSTVVVQSHLLDTVLSEHASQNQKPQNPVPATETRSAGSAVAILHSYRWNIPERHNVHDGEPDLSGWVPPLYPVTDTRLALRFVQPPKHVSYQDFHPSYRLSGWKETNAMYVALNSQYFC